MLVSKYFPAKEKKACKPEASLGLKRCNFVDVMRQFSNSREFIDKLNINFNALIALPLLLIGLGYLQVEHRDWPALLEADRALRGSVVVGLALLVTLISLRFKREARKLAAVNDLSWQMSTYYQLAMFYYKTMFALAMLMAVLLFLWAATELALVYVYLLFWLSIFRPNLRSVADIFGLEGETRRQFINKEI